MAVTAAALRELHHIHQQLSELRDRVERGPKQIRAREANTAQLKAKVDEAKARVQETQLSINRKQLDLKAGEQKVIDARVRLNGASSNKEYQSLVEQIAAAEMAGSVMTDEVLESMEKLDTLQVAVKEAEKLLAAGNQELEKTRQAIESAAASVRGDIERLEAELAKAEAALPADFKVDYQRVVRGKGANGLASVDDDVCGACGQQITLNMQNELRLAKPVFCKSCGCLLYLSE
jgi:predicted  nucleic acid-binding Zn-ribbon protein